MSCSFFKSPFLRLVVGLFILGIWSRGAFGIVNIEPVQSLIPNSGLTQRVQLTFDLDQGNTESLLFQPRYRFDYLKQNHWVFGVAKIKQSSSNDVQTANEGFLHLRYIHSVTDLVTPETFIQTAYNDFQSLKQRSLIGAGWRIGLHQIESFQFFEKLYLGIGFMFEHEEYSKTDQGQHTDLRSTNYVSLKDKTGNFQSSITLYYQPLVSDVSDYRALMIGNLAVPITQSIDFSTSLEWRYNSHPADGTDPRDLSISSGLEFSL